MKKWAYYNEIDPYAAQWIRNLIKAGHIADGEVDERSIEDVSPSDVRGFARAHFFSGIATWDYALNRAGYDRWDTVTWTGSCPCQPFSAAGKGAGTADERHLWPAWFHLIEQCKPEVVFGEQVEAAVKHGWLDLVQNDLEGSGYAFGAVCIPAAGVGAPHIRSRLWFVAHSAISGKRALYGESRPGVQPQEPTRGLDISSGLADTISKGLEGHGRPGEKPISQGWEGEKRHGSTASPISNAAPTNGFWREADWIYCRDGKYRPIKSGLEPLVARTAGRVGRLRAYGNAICAPVAEEFIRAYMND